MQPRARVRHVAPEADQPAVSVLIAIGILALLAGLASARWLAGTMQSQQSDDSAGALAATRATPTRVAPSPVEDAGTDAGQREAERTDDADGGEHEKLRSLAVDAGGVRDAAVATTASLPMVAEVRTNDAGAARTSPRVSAKFVQGTVAYLRCDGLPQRRGPFPCPRDRRLERAAWGLLARLPSCAVADPGRGAAELRVELTRDGPTSVHFMPRGDASADVRSIERCLGAAARSLRTALRSERMVVAFRFELR